MMFPVLENNQESGDSKQCVGMTCIMHEDKCFEFQTVMQWTDMLNFWIVSDGL